MLFHQVTRIGLACYIFRLLRGPLPLLYSAGLALPEEEITYPHEEVLFGGLSMRTVQVS